MTQDKKNEISFFDQIAEEEREYIALSTKSYDRLFAELSKCLDQSKNRIKIVDLGCGTGSLTKKLLSLNSEVYGCDISSKCIETASKLYPNINFSIQDIENLSFDDNFLDIDWRLPLRDIYLSDKDKCHPKFLEMPKHVI